MQVQPSFPNLLRARTRPGFKPGGQNTLPPTTGKQGVPFGSRGVRVRELGPHTPRVGPRSARARCPGALCARASAQSRPRTSRALAPPRPPSPGLPSIPDSLRQAARSHPARSREPGAQGRGGALRSARRRPAPFWLAAPALAAPWLAAGRGAGPPGRGWGRGSGAGRACAALGSAPVQVGGWRRRRGGRGRGRG